MVKTVCIFLLFCNCCFSQVLKRQVNVHGAINRLDYFVGTSGYTKRNHWVLGSGFAVGITRTFAQQRFFPRLTFSGGRNVIETQKFRLTAEARTAFSLLNLRTTQNNYHHWQEYMGGLSCSIGEKIRFNLALSAGWTNENFKDTYTQKRVNFGTIGYEASLALGYAW